MFNKIAARLRKNWMLVLPIASAVASFLLSFWLKIVLAAENYGDFATAFFIVNVLIGLGVVGYDHVIIRLSKLTENGLEIDRPLLFVGILILLLTPTFSFVFLKNFGVVSEFNSVFILLSFSTACIAVLTVLFNLQGRLLESYLFLGSWKVVLSIVIAFLYLFDVSIENFEFLILFSLSSTFLWFFVFRKKIFHLVKNQVKIKALFLLYFTSLISLISYQAFEGLDRFLLLDNFDKVLFGDYFFVFNFIMAPTSIFVSYYSVSCLKKYKAFFSYKEMLNDVLKVFYFTSFMIFFLCIVLFFLSEIQFVRFPAITMSLMFLISCVCIIRNCYLVVSVSYRVVASKLSLTLVAFIFGTLACFFYWLSSLNILEPSMEMIISFILFLWVLRTLVYFLVVKIDSLKNNQVDIYET
ncbi:hypothetical protein ORJ66_00985 [Pseudoalteromonas tunicata]|uniref:hypothetical protein n=1 Tax=Pseudoalteromonas tunicata TaxID=314281 RepID=UPI00273DD097|nr:hypothetical protein [Pseudoalteromonas tunicata]MDP5211618.1 hypothetical protein [Pseudoalteromonas tunicata]